MDSNIIFPDIIPGMYELRGPSNKSEDAFPLVEALKPIKYITLMKSYKLGEPLKYSTSNSF